MSTDSSPVASSPDTYTPQEIAALCGLSRRRVYDWLTQGWLRGHRNGGRWVVTAGDWEFFTRTARGAQNRLRPSLRDWQPLWEAQPVIEIQAKNEFF